MHAMQLLHEHGEYWIGKRRQGLSRCFIHTVFIKHFKNIFGCMIKSQSREEGVITKISSYYVLMSFVVHRLRISHCNVGEAGE